MKYIIDNLKTDCRKFDASKPCKPHKELGVFCDTCSYYDPVTFRILIIKFGSLGDVVRTTSILPGLKKTYPGASIFWLTAQNCAQVFLHNSLVDKVFTDVTEYSPLLDVMEFDLVINLETDIRSSAYATKVKSPVKRGFTLSKQGIVQPINSDAEEWYALGVNDNLKKKNTTTYFNHIYKIAGLTFENEKPVISLSVKEKQASQEFLERHGFSQKNLVVGINTGSGGRWPLKKWTFENYRLLIEKLHEDFSDIGLILLGGPEESKFNESLISSLSFDIATPGTQNSLREFITYVDCVDILFTPDSLALHIGVALDKYVVTYTGPTSYTELDVFGKGAIVHADIDCLGCYLNHCEKVVNCMNTLSVEYIYDTIRSCIVQNNR